MDLVTREAVVLDVKRKNPPKNTPGSFSDGGYKPSAGLLTENTVDWKPDLFKYEVTGDILTFLHLFC